MRVPLRMVGPRDWGRCFEILDFQPWGFAEQTGRKDGQGYALLRRRDAHVDAAALEAPGPSAEDELRAVAANLAFVNREMAAWRTLAAAAGARVRGRRRARRTRSRSEWIGSSGGDAVSPGTCRVVVGRPQPQTDAVRPRALPLPFLGRL